MSSTRTEPVGEWYPLHTYLPMSLQTGFLREVVRPAVRDAGMEGRVWFLRYWQGGPHIRLRLHRPTAAAAASVRSALEAGVPELTAEHRAEFDRQASLQPGLGELEGAEPVEARAAGTVEHAVYSPEYAKYGGTTGLAVAEELYRATSGAVLDLIASRSELELKAPAGLAIRTMAMALKGSGLDMKQSREFLGIYEEEWRRWVPPGYDDKWPGMYEKTRGKVVGLCRAVWCDGASDVFHDAYAAALESARAVQQGATGGDVQDLVLEETPYAHCLANYIHTTNNRLGILPAAEAFLAYVVQRAITDLQAASEGVESAGGQGVVTG